MTYGVWELLWIKHVLQDSRIDYAIPIRLHCDNKAAIEIAYNPVQHDRTKHVEVDQHFIKKNLNRKIIEFRFVRSEDQLADILTKAISGKAFDEAIRKLGMIDIYAPTWEGMLKYSHSVHIAVYYYNRVIDFLVV